MFHMGTTQGGIYINKWHSVNNLTQDELLPSGVTKLL
jgi:hypothetical protein